MACAPVELVLTVRVAELGRAAMAVGATRATDRTAGTATSVRILRMRVSQFSLWML